MNRGKMRKKQRSIHVASFSLFLHARAKGVSPWYLIFKFAPGAGVQNWMSNWENNDPINQV
ncbi:hypothetical protein [Bacillus sp. 166amftsu]|nr:hypothetical protein [Bacillus sp. 166amftsu]